MKKNNKINNIPNIINISNIWNAIENREKTNLEKTGRIIFTTIGFIGLISMGVTLVFSEKADISMVIKISSLIFTIIISVIALALIYGKLSGSLLKQQKELQKLLCSEGILTEGVITTLSDPMFFFWSARRFLGYTFQDSHGREIKVLNTGVRIKKNTLSAGSKVTVLYSPEKPQYLNIILLDNPKEYEQLKNNKNIHN